MVDPAQPVSNGGTCVECGAGKYKSGTGNEACTDCEAGKYSTAVGQTAEDCEMPATGEMMACV